MESKKIEIKSVNGHYEVYLNGEFLFSADTRHEVNLELQEIENQKHIK